MAQLHLLQLTKLGSENGTGGPFGVTLKQYAEQLGVHTSDAVADWLLSRLARTLDSFAKLHGPSST